MDKTAEDLKVRTKRFAIAVLDFIETPPRGLAVEALSRQLARAGLGVAGNYRSSCRARSHAEFTARLGIVLEEADESDLWLEVATERQMGETSKREWLLDESRQLRAIFLKGLYNGPHPRLSSALAAVRLPFRLPTFQALPSDSPTLRPPSFPSFGPSLLQSRNPAILQLVR